MVIHVEQTQLVPITVKLERVDVELLDRLAKLEGLNRSQELRSMLSQLRPMLRATVEAFEQAHQAREKLSQATAEATVSQFQELLPDVEKMQGEYLGIMARLEGLAAADEAQDPRSSNHGGHTPTPPTTEDL